MTRRDRPGRGQSSVVGVALLLGATVVALGVLTASVGTLVDGHVARTDATRVATDVDEALTPVETTGHESGRIRFARGQLRTAERALRVFDSGGLVARFPADALVYERGQHRVAFVAGAIVREHGRSAWLVREPPVVAGPDVLVIGVPVLGAEHAGVGGSRVDTRIETNVSHHRRRLPSGRYRIAVETETPDALAADARSDGATVTRRDFDGDGVTSVVADYPGNRTAFLVEHRMRLEVTDG